MSSNVFSALAPEKKGKKASAPADSKQSFAAYVKQKSTSAWGDESDDEDAHAASAADPAAQADAEEEDEEEDESESESEEEEEEDEDTADDKPTATEQPKKKEPAARTLSKKERKKLEMDEFESALAELGIAPTAPVAEQKAPPAAEQKKDEPASGSASKKKKKGKKKAPAAASEATSAELAAPVDIKAVLKAKTAKKKKSSDPASVRIAREQVAKDKAKKKGRDKASFNEFSI